MPLSSPPFHLGGNTTYSSGGESMASIQPEGYGSNNRADWGYDGSDRSALYNIGSSIAYGPSTGGIVEGEAYGRNDAMYRVDGGTLLLNVPGYWRVIGDRSAVIHSAAAQSQSITSASTSTLQLSQNSSPYDPLHATQGLEVFEQRHRALHYGPIPHTSIQLSNSLCFRTQHRTVNHRSAPYSVVYRQEKSQGPVYNGSIHGNVQNFQISNIDAGILQYLKEHAATGAMHDSDERFPPPLCHPGTREAVIYRILDWYGYQAGPRKPIMWVYAPAGYGKTAIAGTVSEKLEEKLMELKFNPLGGTFFFWRTSTERNSPARFIVTLTYQVFISIPELAPHIENAVKRNPMILRKALEVQLKKLLVEPFQALGDTKGMPNRLIIVDGLDECINSDRESRVDKKYAEDQETVQLRVLDLIRSLASHRLPLSFLILSRPEAWIKQRMESTSLKNLVEHVDLYEVGDHMKDVETFVKAELSRLGLDEESLVTRLVRRANGHILYASTVIRHIDCPYDDARTRLENILNDHSNSNPDLAHSTPFSSLNELYRQILRSCPEGTRSVMIDVLEEVYEASFCFDQYVSMHEVVNVFDHIVGRVPGAGMKAIRGLHALLCGQWTAELSKRPDTAEYRADVVEMLGKLLDIDLMACFVHAFTLYSAAQATLNPHPDICKDDSSNFLISEAYAGVYESNTLVKGAVSRVVTAHKAAVLHVLQTQTLIANECCTHLPLAVYELLRELSERPGDWNSDSVVHALKTLQQASSDLFDNLMAGVEERLQGDLDQGTFEDEEDQSYYALIALIQDNGCAT
ncbi:hypothetical protein EST38_g5078 [Candolleomyces aberdarensis]|uniref:Nephrocystin 3-like N-terminal domain-containing protein n=1 Tax=Candolleomyces aberdarensis TaxID=2316362 RepID=A0A4Q2DN72_9AGAR|nr:hypothetical protein EST38_g5078 [Candolleomyces aberdarensis]